MTEQKELQEITLQSNVSVNPNNLKQITNPPARTVPQPPLNRSVKKLGKYQFSMDQKIGSGMAGEVFVGINTQNCELICIKIIDRQNFKTQQKKQLLDNEIRCQQLCHSMHTIKIMDIFDTPTFCFIVAEFCEGGDLFRFLKSSANGVPDKVVIQFGKQIAQALKTLKEAGIVHRDIKSENILLQKNICKLGDFGFAIESNKLSKQKKFNLGSPLYMSIEALQQSSYSYSSDVFAYGVVLYEMLHKKSPWECDDEKELLLKMKTEEVIFKNDVNEDLKALIKSCLNKKPQDRPSIQSILQNPIFLMQEAQTSTFIPKSEPQLIQISQ